MFTPVNKSILTEYEVRRKITGSLKKDCSWVEYGYY